MCRFKDKDVIVTVLVSFTPALIELFTVFIIFFFIIVSDLGRKYNHSMSVVVQILFSGSGDSACSLHYNWIKQVVCVFRLKNCENKQCCCFRSKWVFFTVNHSRLSFVNYRRISRIAKVGQTSGQEGADPQCCHLSIFPPMSCRISALKILQSIVVYWNVLFCVIIYWLFFNSCALWWKPGKVAYSIHINAQSIPATFLISCMNI